MELRQNAVEPDNVPRDAGRNLEFASLPGGAAIGGS